MVFQLVTATEMADAINRIPMAPGLLTLRVPIRVDRGRPPSDDLGPHQPRAVIFRRPDDKSEWHLQVEV